MSTGANPWRIRWEGNWASRVHVNKADVLLCFVSRAGIADIRAGLMPGNRPHWQTLMYNMLLHMTYGVAYDSVITTQTSC